MTKQLSINLSFKRVLIFWLIGAIFFSLFSPSVYAQGGCPAEPEPALGVEHTVIEALPLAAHISEASSTQLNRSFYETTVEFTFDPTTSRTLLASSPDGRGRLCTDDLIRVVSQDWKFELDLRSADGERIVHADPIDISHMFSAGENRLTIELVDLAPGNYSASPLWLVIVEATTPVVLITATATPMPTPTPSPSASSTPTALPEPTATATPRPTATPLPVLLLEAPPSIPSEANTPRWPVGMLAGLGVAILALLLLLWRRQARPLLPVGEVKVYRGSTYLETYPLAAFRKPIVTVGKAGDISLADETVADFVAQFRASRVEDGEIETVVDQLDPEEPKTVIHSEPLRHGDQLQFGPFTLQYADYAQETVLIVKGEDYRV